MLERGKSKAAFLQLKLGIVLMISARFAIQIRNRVYSLPQTSRGEGKEAARLAKVTIQIGKVASEGFAMLAIRSASKRYRRYRGTIRFRGASATFGLPISLSIEFSFPVAIVSRKYRIENWFLTSAL